MANFIEDLYYGNLEPQECTTLQTDSFLMNIIFRKR